MTGLPEGTTRFFPPQKLQNVLIRKAYHHCPGAVIGLTCPVCATQGVKDEAARSRPDPKRKVLFRYASTHLQCSVQAEDQTACTGLQQQFLPFKGRRLPYDPNIGQTKICRTVAGDERQALPPDFHIFNNHFISFPPGPGLGAGMAGRRPGRFSGCTLWICSPGNAGPLRRVVLLPAGGRRYPLTVRRGRVPIQVFA